MKIFDAHFHIINPNYPLVPNQGYIPAKFTTEDYRNRLNKIKLVGGAVVSGSFQAFDQEYLVDSLKILGGKFYGVANIPVDMTDSELRRLDQIGVRAVRFNLKRGGSEQVKHLEYLSKKLYHEFNWHTELYLDSKDIQPLLSTLVSLPAYSIDHLGLSESGLDDLYRCVEHGARVKATGFGRINFDPILVMQKIYEINQEALLFGTDLPSTRANVSFSNKDVELIRKQFSKEGQERIFYRNAIKWYSDPN